MSTPTITPDAETADETADTAEATEATETTGTTGSGGRAAKLKAYAPGRREAMFLLGGGVIGAAFTGGTWGARAMSAPGAVLPASRDDEEALSGKEALERLVQGNERFVSGAVTHPDQATARRSALKEGQAPFAAILSCADSRVPPELVFDQGLGDLFVVRSAGQVVDSAVLGSLQYGVAELGVGLLVVLGHSRCGAVKATVEALTKKSKPTGTSIDALVNAIRPAVQEAHGVGATEKNIVSVSVDMNVELGVDRLKGAPLLSPAVKTRKLKVVGATYDVSTGEVEWL